MNIKPQTDLKSPVSSLLFGLAVGDALGVPVEFRPRGSFHIDGMTGYGTHNQPTGTWSDDTSLALCLAASIAEGFSLEDLVRRFIRWRREAYMTATGTVFDIGISTAKAIDRLERGVTPDKSGCTGINENGNGSLMRIAPLVFLTVDKPEAERFALTKAVSSITHAHSWSVAACFIYLEYLRNLFLGMDKNAAYTDLQEQIYAGIPYFDAGTISRFHRILEADICSLPEAEIKSGGFVIDTLEAAMWCFLITDNYKDAVLKAVNLGEDTDTTAAVTGALAGLFYGLDAVPLEWRETLACSGDIARLAGEC
jgi:ADP-ribosylglycohydrolase